MKVWKKNMVAAAVLVTVCAGIYVNWLYTEDMATANLEDTLDAEKVMSDDTLVLSEDISAIAAGEDVQTTRVIAKALHTVDIRLMDHLVFSKTDYVSLRESGYYDPRIVYEQL